MRSKHIILILLVLAGCGGGITAHKVVDYDSLIKSGWTKYNQNKFDEAYQIFIQAKEMDEGKPEGYIGSGWSLLMRQHPDSALVEFFHGFDYVASLDDTVDTVSGIAGSYLANHENSRVISLLSAYDLDYFENSFPLKDHDFFLDREDLEMVWAQAYYRLGIYSSNESADPDNALYHLNKVFITPYEYTDPIELMEKMTEYLYQSGGGFYR